MSAHPSEPSARPGESAGRIPVDLRRLPGIRRLAADYADDFPALAEFYAGDPTQRDAWTASIARAQAYDRPRRALATVLEAQQSRRGAPEPAIAAARQLADARTVAVVTGQQAGLFGGPLYTLLKAMTALRLAEAATRDHGVPAVAVFWIDAEDHDWDEVRSCTVFDDALAARRVELPAALAGDAASVARVTLDDSVVAALDTLEQLLPGTEFREALVADLRRFYAPGVGMATAFGCWLEQILGPRGLVVYDASDPAAKRFAGGIFARELSSPGETSMLAATAGAALVARGYHAQVQPADGTCALFRLDGGRQSIRVSDAAFLVGDRPIPAATLVQEATDRPDGFSPNVLLRPIVQDAIFPTIAYVAGPSELAYLGQLRAVYAHFQVPMPLMYPRATATILDRAAVRFLSKYDLPLDALEPQDDSALNALLASQIPPHVDAAFDDVRSAIDARMARLIEALPAVDPTLEGMGHSTLKRMQQDLGTLHGKMIQAAKRRDETLRRQWIRTRALAFPEGHPQERAVAFVWFLNQYGPALVDRLWEELPLDLGRHWIITI